MVLDKYGIDIDSAENGVWLSQKGHAPTFFSHPDRSYYDYINTETTSAAARGGRQGVLDFLASTKQSLAGIDQDVRYSHYGL